MHVPEAHLQAQLALLARQSAWFMPALEAVRALHLESWCIGAGAVRNLVWYHLHQFEAPTKLKDVDVAYFDASDLRPETEQAVQSVLSARCPSVPWEVTNQAAVHLWFEGHFGHPVPPLSSLQDAVASWPEFATSVGLTLTEDSTIEVIAPYGLNDLFSTVVRRNPARVSVETYRRRLAEKRYSEHWPKVAVVPC
jgi:uncharacterized protein